MDSEGNKPEFGIDNNSQNESDQQQIEKEYSAVTQTYNSSQEQLQWMNRQVSHLERQLLLNNNAALNYNFMSNWTKVILSVLAAIIPGIGQLMGIIVGLVFVADDINSDKRSFGAALLTISLIVFILSIGFWFLLAVAFSPVRY